MWANKLPSSLPLFIVCYCCKRRLVCCVTFATLREGHSTTTLTCSQHVNRLYLSSSCSPFAKIQSFQIHAANLGVKEKFVKYLTMNCTRLSKSWQKPTVVHNTQLSVLGGWGQPPRGSRVEVGFTRL